MVLVCLFVFCTVSAESDVISDRENQNDNGLNSSISLSSEAFALILGQTVGFPRLWVEQTGPTKPMFSDNLIREMTLESNEDKDAVPDPGERCSYDLYRVISNANESWALQMLDSDGKLPPGVLYGHVGWTGSYRECLAVQAPVDRNNVTGFGGKYCTLSWKANSKMLPLTETGMKTGVCVPDSCNESDLLMPLNFKKFIMSRLHQNLALSMDILKDLARVNKVYCHSQAEWDLWAIVVLCLIAIFGIFVLLGSINSVLPIFCQTSNVTKFEPIRLLSNKERNDGKSNKANDKHERQEIAPEEKRNEANDRPEGQETAPEEEQLVPAAVCRPNPVFAEGEREQPDADVGSVARIWMDFMESVKCVPFRKFLKCFSVIDNGAKIFNTTQNKNEIIFLHGIRFLSMAWIILGHTYVFAVSSASVGNKYDVLNLANNALCQVILQANFAVDTFFILSGFLVTEKLSRTFSQSDGKIKVLVMLFFHRYWRLTPVYAMVIAFDTTISQHFISGPFQPVLYDNGCAKNWWKNLLYINSCFEENMCLVWTWYLGCDMIFYLLNCFIFYFLWQKPNVVSLLMFALGLISLMINGVLCYCYNIFTPYTTMPKIEEVMDYLNMIELYFHKMYIKPYTRIVPYFIGSFLGYKWVCIKRNIDKQSATSVFPKVWLILTWMGLMMLICISVFAFYNNDFDLIGRVAYNTLIRLVFSTSVAGMIFLCLKDHGGVVQKLLSHPIFIPLSRCSYCAYLIHPIVMVVYFLCLPQSFILSHFQMVIHFFGFLAMSYILGLITSLLFECPIMAIEKMFKE